MVLFSIPYPDAVNAATVTACSNDIVDIAVGRG
jgi:hypothetical protein